MIASSGFAAADGFKVRVFSGAIELDVSRSLAILLSGFCQNVLGCLVRVINAYYPQLVLIYVKCEGKSFNDVNGDKLPSKITLYIKGAIYSMKTKGHGWN